MISVKSFASTRLLATRLFTAAASNSRRAFSSSIPPHPKTDPHISTYIGNPRSVLTGLSSLIRFGATAYVIQFYICNTTLSVGPSMQPTLNPLGDILFTEYITPRLSRLKAGDIVVAAKPTDPHLSVLKRIRGMPGEVIWVHPIGKNAPIRFKVPDGHVWLEGDNRNQSTDSRHYGPVPLALVKGRARFRFWPPSQAGVLRSVVIDHTVKTRGLLEKAHGANVGVCDDSKHFQLGFRKTSPSHWRHIILQENETQNVQKDLNGNMTASGMVTSFSFDGRGCSKYEKRGPKVLGTAACLES